MRVTAVLIACAAALVAGCGSSAKTSGSGPNTNDKRATALDCLKNEQKVDARLLGKDGLQVGDPARRTRIKFFLTNGEAEAAQFEGRGEGSEQIGPALLFVGKASDAELEKVEKCLDDIASG
jgi:hypothetical protein